MLNDRTPTGSYTALEDKCCCAKKKSLFGFFFASECLQAGFNFTILTMYFEVAFVYSALFHKTLHSVCYKTGCKYINDCITAGNLRSSSYGNCSTIWHESLFRGKEKDFIYILIYILQIRNKSYCPFYDSFSISRSLSLQPKDEPLRTEVPLSKFLMLFTNRILILMKAVVFISWRARYQR